MAIQQTADGPAFAERQLFVRKATGLVRGWSVRDAFIYATLSINLITLGLYIFSYQPFIPGGSLLWSVLIGGAYLVVQAITYAALIAAMPRAGGDYVWISRVLGGGLGFVLAVAGWWFILWLWVPIYANILNVEVAGPLSAIVGWHSGVTFWASHNGTFVLSVITALVASVLISLGMRTYAKIQRWCFYGGLFGLAVMMIVLLVNSRTGFISAFNQQSQSLYGVSDAYHKTLVAGTKGYVPPGLTTFAIGSTFFLIPMMAFFNLWCNWGATLYGEVRGASDFRKNIYAMGGALIATTIAALILFLLFSKTFGWRFYEASNSAYWAGTSPTGGWYYPATLAAAFFHSRVLSFIFIAIMSLWFFGWVGTLFLSSTRVVFATAFDRVLPEVASRVSGNGVPYPALALMLIPGLGVSALYAYNTKFATYTLDATLVIAVTFLGSAVAAMVLPYRKPEIYNASPIARYKIAGLPLITVASGLFIVFLVFCLYKWLQDSAYGVNNSSSLIFMGALYVLAIVIYAVSKYVRRRQGMDLSLVYGEIPVE
ncbi:MAG TPA: APC family permease [Solirubrobacteraceae bacterium]|nr:APC family permease [Solirubrobacteraceae bacterium]